MSELVLPTFRSLADLRIDYARELNEQQHAAATASPGPALVIAGAGSGKTRTLVYRVAFLLEQGIPPDRMLLLTFTNKAAREMMQRVGELLGQEVPGLWGGTFHSIGNRILRRHAELLGYPRNFTILDREDAQHLLTTCREEVKAKAGGEKFPRANEFADIFSFAANTGEPVQGLVEEEYGLAKELAPLVEEMQRRYAELKRAADSMDFDDLLVLWLKLLKEQPDVLEHYQRRFQFLLVDEYQDTNKIQGELIDLLAARHQNVMAVGDDSQSIYAWRGAYYRNIFEFPERYPAATVYKIETNYRSTPEILAVANAIMTPSPQRYTKVLAPARKPGEKPLLAACASGKEQAAFVAQRILGLHEEGIGLNKMAVLYRSHFHAMELQLELKRCGIPFHLASGTRVFEQAHIKDVAAYLRLVQNPRDEVAFKRLARMLPGVGAKGADKLWRAFESACRQSSTPPSLKASAFAEASARQVGASGPPSQGFGASGEQEKGEVAPIATALQACAGQLPKKTEVHWAQFMATIAQLENKEIASDPTKMMHLVLDAGYEDFLRDNYANYRSRLEDLHRLAEYALQFETVEEFLTQLALLTNVESEAEQAPREKEERLQLSTVHQAKGLEFDVVFIIMLGEGLFPSKRAAKSHEDLEEERRLLYVAITRARNLLFLSYPFCRLTGEGRLEMVQPSSFLSGISKDLVEQIGPSAPNLGFMT